jgi:hypothetical protein
MTEIDPRLSDLYREAATETPSATVDAAILAAARKRVATPRRRPPSRWSRWLVPVSLTATLVLGVSLGLLIEREHPERLRGDQAGPVPARPDHAPTPAGSTEEKSAASAGMTPPAANNQTQDAAPARRAAPPAAATHEAETQPAASLAEDRSAAPLAAERYRAEPASQATAAKAARESSLAVDSAPGLGAAAAKPAAARTAAPRSPESWFDAIRRLLREGRNQEAAAQLAEFRKAYPDYDLPEDLARPRPPP